MQTSRVTPLWLFPLDSPQKEISQNEMQVAELLPHKRSIQYKHARGNARFVLSEFFKRKPLDIPLLSLPGEAPILGDNLGYLSISHCNDALLIGWSNQQLGIDLERSDRNFSSNKIVDRFFNEDDQKKFTNLTGEKLRSAVLNYWVIKEALIKWQKGKLSKDLKEWNINSNWNVATHKKLNYKVNIYNFQFKCWTIGIASNQNFDLNNILICAK